MRKAIALWGIGQTLCWCAWLVGSVWLPAGVLRGTSVAAHLPLEAWPFWPRAAAILAWNLLLTSLLIAAANLLRWQRLPLGFVPVLCFWTLYGLLLGTNSFAAPLPERPTPALATLVQRAGLYELTGYTLVAAATASWARWRQMGLIAGPVERIVPKPLAPASYAMLVLAVLLLVGAALREAAMLEALAW